MLKRLCTYDLTALPIHIHTQCILPKKRAVQDFLPYFGITSILQSYPWATPLNKGAIWYVPLKYNKWREQFLC